MDDPAVRVKVDDAVDGPERSGVDAAHGRLERVEVRPRAQEPGHRDPRAPGREEDLRSFDTVSYSQFLLAH